MKKLLLLGAITIGVLAASSARAQVSVHVNIGTQPSWGPVGYDYAEYYYMPDIDVYYSVPRREYVYLDGGRWVFAASLPGRCRDYDIYRGYKVVINEPSPWMHCNVYRERYSRYRGWYGRQMVIRDSRDDRYRRYDDRYERRDRDYDRHDHYDHPGNNGNGRGHGWGRRNKDWQN